MNLDNMKIKDKGLIIFIIAVIVLIITSGLLILDITQNRNINFDTQEIFFEGGYKDAYSNSILKKQEYDQQIADNKQRLDSYGIDFNQLISEIEAGKLEESLKTLNDAETDVSDIKLYREDVLLILKQEFLNLNIAIYDLVVDNELSDSSSGQRLYRKLLNIEIIYDAFDNGLEIEEVNILDTRMEQATGNGLRTWGLAISRSKVTMILIVYTVLSLGVIIYRFIKGKSTKLLVIFTLILLASVFIVRMFEDNYKPIYAQINNELGVIQNTEGQYFMDVSEVLVITKFVDTVNAEKNQAEIEEWKNELILAFENPYDMTAWMEADSGVINPNDEDSHNYSNQALFAEIERDIQDNLGQ